jgi:hypothetical protein
VDLLCRRGQLGSLVDAKTEELRAAHDVLAEFYADRLAGALDRMTAERTVLGLFCELTLAAGLGTTVGDIGCGTGRLAPCLATRGLSPQGIDLSGGRCWLCGRVLGRAPRRRPGGFPAGIPARPQVLKPPSQADEVHQVRKLADHQLCARSGM